MTSALPSTPYIQDLLDQPRALRTTLDGLRGQQLPGAITGRLKSGPAKTGFQVVLTGMGSSLHAFHPLQQALIRRQVPVYLLETSELLHTYDRLLRPESLLIAASQSGRSAEIIALLDRLPPNTDLIGVTNTPSSPLAQHASAPVFTAAGQEATVSCKTYLATLAALAWLEPVLFGEDPAPVLAELEAGLPALEAYLGGMAEHVAFLAKGMRATRDVFVVGRGPSLATAFTGGLIIKESTHRHGEGMSSAGYRHGPLEMLSPEVFVLVCEGLEPAAQLNRRLYADILKAGGHAGLVSPNAQETVFRIPPVGAVSLPVFEMLPVQMITLALAEVQGHEAGRFSLNSKVTEVE